MNRLSLSAGLASVIAIVGLSGPAQAVDVTREYFSHGVANCQAALPAFDGNIRKRPMGISNEGTGNAFITCDTEAQDNFNQQKFPGVTVYFTNRSAAAVSVSCTLVNGLLPFLPATFFPKSSPSMAPGASDRITWSTLDNGGNNFGYPAVSCNLPISVELNATKFIYVENVGA